MNFPRLSALVLAAALAGSLAGCSSLNPFSSSAKAKPALSPIEASAQLKILWQSKIAPAGEFVFTPAVVGKSVFAAAKDGTIVRLDEGRETWRIAAGQPLTGGVGADGRLVAVGTGKGELLAFDAATGNPLWKARVTSDILDAPAIGDGLVAVRSGDARIFAFEAADGRRRWIYQRSTPSLSLRTSAGLLFTPRGIVAGFPGGKLVVINAANGAALWEGVVAVPKGATELERIADVTGSPVALGRQLCAAAYQGRVACFDLDSGSPLWSRELSTSTGADMDERNVYVSDEKGNVQAFERESGSSLWKQDALAGRGLSRPLAFGSRIVVADGDGMVHLLRREDGAFAARTATDGSAVLAGPQRVPGGFVVQTGNGGLYAFAVE
jgi:outer membrane protein assembly factor BamB